MKIERLPEESREIRNGYQFQFRILNHLATIYRNQKEYQKEQENLIKIYDIYKELMNTEKMYKTNLDNWEKQVLQIKQELYYRDDTELTQRLYQLNKVDIPNLKKKISEVQTIRKSFHIGKILERIAYIFYMNKKLKESLEYYQMILKMDFIPKSRIRRAINNINVLKKMIQTGWLLPIQMDENFER